MSGFPCGILDHTGARGCGLGRVARGRETGVLSGPDHLLGGESDLGGILHPDAGAGGSMSDDESAFIDAIREAPEDDAPRLVYADWLDEHAGTVPCDQCDRGDTQGSSKQWMSSCAKCGHTGWVSNGSTERAEFIRRACAHPHGLPFFRPLSDIGVALRAGLDAYLDDRAFPGPNTANPRQPGLLWHRGLIAEIRCFSCAAWLEHAAAVLERHPLERVVLSDKRPEVWARTEAGVEAVWEWNPDHEDRYNALPPAIWNLMSLALIERDPIFRSYPSEKAAVDALSQACLRYGLARLRGEPDPLPDGASSPLPPPLPRRRPARAILAREG
jgi:uncharacterized protein (TIGR02996 family)